MLTLYVETGCAFSQKVLDMGEALGLEFNLKNIAEPGVTEELIERGGRKQLPFLVDDENDVEMYDSQDIVQYLAEHYGPIPPQ